MATLTTTTTTKTTTQPTLALKPNPTTNKDATNSNSPYTGLRIIHAALFRTATASMSAAYRELGYTPHHGLDNVLYTPRWSSLEAAAEATWPSIPGAPTPPRQPFTRADWDALWSPFDVCTDLGSYFAPELIAKYPDAKVVIVKRHADKWWPSFQSECLDTLWHSLTPLVNFIVWHAMGSRAPHAMAKMHCGFFGVASRAELTERLAKERYEQYYEWLLENVPEERRLVYTMGQGWEPLCEFLGKEVPATEFPRVNDREEHRRKVNERFWLMARTLGRWAFVVAVVVLAVFMAIRTS